jgi:acetyl esterase
MGTSENAASHEGRRSNFARVKDGGRAALVITGEYDRLRNEATAYNESLNSAGGLVEHFEVAGADHACNLIGGTRELAETTYDRIVGHVKRAIA